MSLRNYLFLITLFSFRIFKFTDNLPFCSNCFCSFRFLKWSSHSKKIRSGYLYYRGPLFANILRSTFRKHFLEELFFRTFFLLIVLKLQTQWFLCRFIQQTKLFKLSIFINFPSWRKFIVRIFACNEFFC